MGGVLRYWNVRKLFYFISSYGLKGGKPAKPPRLKNEPLVSSGASFVTIIYYCQVYISCLSHLSIAYPIHSFYSCFIIALSMMICYVPCVHCQSRMYYKASILCLHHSDDRPTSGGKASLTFPLSFPPFVQGQHSPPPRTLGPSKFSDACCCCGDPGHRVRDCPSCFNICYMNISELQATLVEKLLVTCCHCGDLES